MADWTEIICILDRSGSMGGLEADTIGGFNAFVERQRAEPGRARLSLVLFDDDYEMPWANVDVQNAKELDEHLYFVRGSTALLDAVGKAVSAVRGRIAAEHVDERPTHVAVLIVTDGYENASREYTRSKIRRLVAETQNEGWEYVFLGADIDAFHSSRQLAVAGGSTSRVVKSSAGMREAYSKLNRAVSDIRRTGTKGDVDADLGDDDLI